MSWARGLKIHVAPQRPTLCHPATDREPRSPSDLIRRRPARFVRGRAAHGTPSAMPRRALCGTSTRVRNRISIRKRIPIRPGRLVFQSARSRRAIVTVRTGRTMRRLRRMRCRRRRLPVRLGRLSLSTARARHRESGQRKKKDCGPAHGGECGQSRATPVYVAPPRRPSAFADTDSSDN
jgi:hypothetical protein